MPDAGGGDDTGGNPLQEGLLGGWKAPGVRDESFASYKRSLFETPEFETTQLIAPPDLYRDALKAEAKHQYGVQIPKGITDNLHATLGNLQAWVENPYENSKLRPYNQYWKAIRPKHMKPGVLRIGVSEPPMADIINHVAQTDDLTPLREWRGQKKTAGGWGQAAAKLFGGLFGGEAASAAGAEAAGAGAETAAPAVAEGTAAGGEAAGASGIGGMVKKVAPMLMGQADDLVGAGGGGNNQSVAPMNQDMSYYASSDQDDAHPSSHDEIPKNNDGDSNQKSDGDNKDWQKDYADQGGGSLAPSFDPNGAGIERFKMMLPLLMHYLDTGTDGSNDPLVKGLHESLEAEIPGYLNHADDDAANKLVVMIKGLGQQPEHDPAKSEPARDTSDQNAGGKHESKIASLHGEGSAFLPDFEVEIPNLNRRIADTVGPQTPEQIKMVQKYLLEHGEEFGLQGDELLQTILSVPTNPLEFADILSKIQGSDSPPNDGDPAPPPPAQEQAPPEATMPMPGMSAPPQMTSAVERYAADSVAGRCPECKSHTTGILSDDGTSRCHACGAIFKTEGIIPDETKSSKTALFDDAPDDTLPAHNEPMPDQRNQPDLSEERNQAWVDDEGNPLAPGQEYEMSSQKYDIPDQVRIDAVKPDSIIYTISGEFGVSHSTELSHEEASMEGITFTRSSPDVDKPQDEGLEHNNDDNTGYQGPGQSDLSSPHTVSNVQENPKLAWLAEGMRTAGANYTQMEQRALIDEMGSARNSDSLQLKGTHYIDEPDEDNFLFGI